MYFFTIEGASILVIMRSRHTTVIDLINHRFRLTSQLCQPPFTKNSFETIRIRHIHWWGAQLHKVVVMRPYNCIHSEAISLHWPCLCVPIFFGQKTCHHSIFPPDTKSNFPQKYLLHISSSSEMIVDFDLTKRYKKYAELEWRKKFYEQPNHK